MELDTQQETYDALVRRIFRIEDVTIGGPKQGFVMRYRGQLIMDDSEAAYNSLSSLLKPYNLTPLFRWDGSQQSILLVPGMPQPRQSNPMVNLVLGILTVVSVLLTGALYGITGPLPPDPLQAAWVLFQNAWPFAVSLLAILTAHEFGHYLAGRYHGVHLTLPYFIPMPVISPFGTMGAFINMKELPKSRKILMDIAIAGPLAGFIVAVPVLLIGLHLSYVSALTPDPNSLIQLEGNSLIYLLAKYLTFGQLLPAPASYAGTTPVLYWLQYFFTGRPLPIGGTDVMLSGVAWAGWGGMLITAMNLIPAGQLDGGHLLYVLVGRKWAARTLPVVLIFLVLLGFVWNGWWLWAVLIFFLGRAYAEPLDQISTIDTKRKILAALGLMIFLVTFIPVPLILL
jgi:membrane-associated protease RseP (regulator of RpoE activity)